MRDLATIAAEEQTKRGALKAVTLAIANTEDTLARKCAERDAILTELRALKGESDAAWERTFAIVDTEANPVAAEEAILSLSREGVAAARVSEHFEMATEF